MKYFRAIITFPSILLENLILFFKNIEIEEKEELTSDIEHDPEADL